MRKMNTNPTLFESYMTGTDEGKWFTGVARNAIYQLRLGPYMDDPEWDYGTILIDTHIWNSIFCFTFDDPYWGYDWPVKIEWNGSNQELRVEGKWEDRVDEVSQWKLELWRVA